jgi:flagellar hook-length control protein FliK
MSQGLTAPVSGAAQAAATRTARTSAGGLGPPGADSETPAFSSVLDHHVARTAHAEGQHKTTGESGGRRSSHGHRAGNGHHSHKSASAGTTTGGAATAASAILSPSTALPPASGPSDAVQSTAGDTAQNSNFIPATVKPAPAPVAPATQDVNATAADQLSESGSQATAVPTDAGLLAGASVGAAAAPQAAQPTDPQTPQATDPQTQATATLTTAATTPTASADPVAAGTAAGATTESPATAGEAATTVTGQAGEPTAKHSAKAAGPGAAAHGDAQTDSSTTTSATAQPQASSTGAQDAGQNGTGGQPQSPPNQAPLHASPADAQSQPEQAAPTQAANATTPTPGLAAGPTPQTAVTAPTAATAAATGPARYGVGLSEAVETVKTTIELGARQGFSTAKIQLAPANLGQITIHLQKTSDGIIAKVVADHSAAAQTMQQGGDDLRRSLQNSGLHLLRLDIETRGDQRGSADGGTQTSQSDRTAGDNDAAAGDDGASQPTTIVLPNGALVNVLA